MECFFLGFSEKFCKCSVHVFPIFWKYLLYKKKNREKLYKRYIILQKLILNKALFSEFRIFYFNNMNQDPCIFPAILEIHAMVVSIKPEGVPERNFYRRRHSYTK